ncbi:MAG: leucine--tRNA ligase [Candidatus Aenigmatarchaeota archaeon]
MSILKQIEEKWQKIWEERNEFYSKPNGKKFFVTFPYPYVNGLLHLGHALTISRAEFIARYKKLKGYNVLFPQAFHLTGSPIVAAAYRLKQNDEKIKKDLLMQGVKEEEIEKFKKPIYWIEYFLPKAKEAFKKLGCAIDWRRAFTTTELDAHYNKFIEWQYLTLKEKGYISKGKHPVVYDPIVNKVIGDHDRPDEYVGISYIEGYIIKFEGEIKNKKVYFPCFTLRPETVLGTTNIWINPNFEYLICKVNEEYWILPNSIVIEELKGQDFKVEVLEKISSKELLLKEVKNLVTNEFVPILPAEFVDVEIGTGIVMSVPAHAPYDYIALVDLLKTEYKDFAEKCLKNMKSLFKLENYTDFPAKYIVEKMKISSQKDKEKLEKATEEIYSKEYYNAITREFFGKFSNKRIFEIKESFAKELIEKNIAIEYLTLPLRFVSRYNNKVIVKKIEQWFLNYSDTNWKKLAHECVEQMNFYPENLKQEFHRVIDWLRDWAFTHKDILGTPLPWEKEWLIESLSDSTIYMAFYTIAHLIRKIEPEKLTKEFFDFIFLDKGNAEEISKKLKIEKSLLEEIKREFEFWYPLDLRVSGKDLIPNHLAFMIFHHVAIFPKKYWPKGIAINGHVLINGEKMSKSKGNFIPILFALEKNSSDALRFLLALNSFSGIDDINIEYSKINKIEEMLIEWLNFVKENYNKGIESEKYIDKWFENVLKKVVKEVENYYEILDYRNVINKWFELENYFNWYKQRTNEISRKTINEYIKIRSIIVYPIIPHLVSEIFEIIGEKIEWPKVEEIDEKVIKSEEYIKRVLEDLREVIKLVKKEETKEIKIIVASKEKQEFFKKLINSNLSFLEKEKELSKFLKRKTSAEVLNYFTENEEEILKENKDFFEKIFKAKVIIEREEESREEKAIRSLPGKPAIVIK